MNFLIYSYCFIFKVPLWELNYPVKLTIEPNRNILRIYSQINENELNSFRFLDNFQKSYNFLCPFRAGQLIGNRFHRPWLHSAAVFKIYSYVKGSPNIFEEIHNAAKMAIIHSL